MNPPPLPIERLDAGEPFRLANLDKRGVLLALSPGRAVVQYRGESAPASISRATEVIRDLDALL